MLAGCKDRAASADDGLAAGNVEAHDYTTRGIVTALPSSLIDFSVQHEAIPEFKNPDGSLGMNTMQMEFPLGEGFVLDSSIAVGDKVELTFRVEYGNAPRYYVTQVSELPETTVLDFSPLE